MKKFMKGLLATTMVFAMMTSLVGCGGGSEAEAPADETTTLVMATNAAFPPYEFYEGDAIVGIDAEIGAAIAEKMGMDFVIASPESLRPDPALVEECMGFAAESGAKISMTADPVEAVKDADVIYTDVWISMGEEDSAKDRVELLRPYQVNGALMAASGKESTKFMHCLPAVRDYEVTNEVIEGPASIVFDEAENRMHTIKAVMVATIGK